MRKILLSLVVTLSLVLSAVFPLLTTTSTTLSAKAAAVEESTDAIDALFYAVGAELTVEDENYNIVPGEQAEYLAEFDESRKCIKSGFKLIEVGDDISNKIVYVYKKHSNYIMAGIECFGTKIEFGMQVLIRVFNSTEQKVLTTGTALDDANIYQKISLKGLTMEVSNVLCSGSVVVGTYSYTPGYVYCSVEEKNSDESSSEESSSSEEASSIVESSEESSEEISEELSSNEKFEDSDEEDKKFTDTVAEWMGKNLGITVTGTGALVIIAVLIFLLFKK